MPTDPLTITVLDLDAALGGNADLLIGGGFGLYLKQLHLDTGNPVIDKVAGNQDERWIEFFRFG